MNKKEQKYWTAIYDLLGLRIIFCSVFLSLIYSLIHQDTFIIFVTFGIMAICVLFEDSLKNKIMGDKNES